MFPANRSFLTLLAASVLATFATGCSNDALDRRDKVALTSGNAAAANNAIHADDPWPPYVNDTQLSMSGKRGQNVMTNYNKGPVGTEEPPPAATSITMTLPPPAPPTPVQ